MTRRGSASAAPKKLGRSSCKSIKAGARARGAKAAEEHEGPRHTGAEAEVPEAGGMQPSGGHHLRGRERSLLMGRGAPEDNSKAEEDAPPRVGHHATPPMPRAARPAAGNGWAVLHLPGLSNCEGSRILTPEECLVYSNRQAQQTPGSDWLS